jgi:hypothetical protein
MGLRGRKHLSETRQALARAKGDRDGGLVFDSGNLTVDDCTSPGADVPRSELCGYAKAFGGTELFILVSVSSAGVCGAGVWDAQEEEDPEYHSHGEGAHGDSVRSRPKSPKHHQK